MGTSETTYVYDSANQLVRENNQAAGKTWVWTYDNAGNILSRKEYAYTTGTLGAVLDTVPYTYGDSSWGDLLTAYNGQSFTYDGIGNPLTDGTWTYTWEHGRQLAEMSGTNVGGGENDVTVTYTYDSNGMRTGKTVTTNIYHTHSYTETVTAPTCTTGGYTTYTCACGDSYTGAETAALGHDLAETVVEPTYTEQGYTLHACTRCDYEYKDNYTSHGHSYTVSQVVQPTCTDPGYTVYACPCGESYQDDVTAATGHTYTATVVAPTCTEQGYTLHTCSACGNSYQDNVVATIEHSYTATTVAPTCIVPGYILYECECGDSYQENNAAPIGHNYETVTLVEPTCEKAGQIRYRCLNCLGAYTALVPALGHSYIGTSGICTRCGKSTGGGSITPVIPGLPGNPGTSSVQSTGAATLPANESDRILVSTVVQSYSYVYNGGSLSQMTVTTATTEDGTTATTTDTLYFAYDAAGTPQTVTHNGTTYYYSANLQGDVVSILNASGTAVVSYTYDAWGKLLTIAGSMASTLGTHNPLRYRGYVYDAETGLYYVSSRYYDPEMGRFINADDIDLLGANGDFASLNLFAYCGNNPVSRADSNGYFWNTVIGAVAGAIVGGVSAALSGTDITAGIVSGALSGAISGAAVDIAIATGGVGLVALAGVALASGAGGAASSYVNQRMNGRSHDEVDWGTVAIDGVWGAIGGALSFGTADVGGKMCKTLAENLALKGKAFWSQAASDFATTITIAAGTWLNGTKMNLLREGKATVASAY